MSVEYVEAPEPIKAGEYRGSDIMAFGYYRVNLGGFVYLSPHTGFANSVSEEPIPLDSVSLGEDKTYRDLLIENAQRARTAMEPESVLDSGRGK